MATRKQRQLAKEDKELSIFGTTRKVEQEESSLPGCFKILWDKKAGEYLHFKRETINMSLIPLVIGNDETATVIVVSVFDAFVEWDGRFAPMCCLRVAIGKKELFAWLPYTKFDRKRLDSLASKLAGTLPFEQDINKIKGLIEWDVPCAEILKFGQIPEEIDSFDEPDGVIESVVGMCAIACGSEAKEDEEALTEADMLLLQQFEGVFEAIEAEKEAKRQALAEKKAAKAVKKETAKVQVKRTSR
jgi:hypothetical protein